MELFGESPLLLLLFLLRVSQVRGLVQARPHSHVVLAASGHNHRVCVEASLSFPALEFSRMACASDAF